MFIPAEYSRDFNDVDWQDTVVIFGSDWVCENTLSDYTERPVINVGSPNSSIPFSVYNQITLRENLPQLWDSPYAIVNVWPCMSYHTFFGSGKSSNVTENMDTKMGKQFYDLWNLHGSNPGGHCNFLRRAAKLMWDKRSLFIETTHEQLTANAFDIECVAEDKIAEFILNHLQ